MRDLLETTRRIEAPSELVAKALVLDKPILARRPNRLLVQPHGIKVPAFDASKLGQHQCVLVAESRWIVFSPLPQLFPVHRQELAPPLLLVSRSVPVERRYR